MTYSSIAAETRRATGIGDNSVRPSAGIEDVAD